jgi:7-carboxy-7-deazaguanine synthase
VDDLRLRISEIFLSLQGEARDAGWPTVFVRLTGCPLRCSWCDTAYAFTGGELMGVEAVLQAVADHARRPVGGPLRHVCVTGGEPLAQRPCLDLLTRLCDAGYAVSLETSGALDIAAVDPRVSRVMDLKTPGSGEAARNRWENIEALRPADQVKLVIADRDDYDWAAAVLQRYDLPARCDVLFSPVAGRLPPERLADWILADRLPVRFQLQLHKVLWGDARGR